METITIAEPIFENVELETSFNANALLAMINDDTIPFVVRKQLTKFNKNKLNHNTFADRYKFKEKTIGRMYSDFQQIPREYRAELLGENCVEIDFNNCHPTLIAKCGDFYGVSTAGIKYYIENRELCLQQTHEDRKTAKEFFLKAQYGYDVAGISKTLDDFCKEVNIICKMMMSDPALKHIYKYAETQYKKQNCPKYKSLPASFQSFVLQTIESRNMLYLYKYLKENDVCVKLLNHDGIIIDCGSFDYEANKTEMEKYILDNTKFHAPIGFKLCEHTYKPAPRNYVIVNSERDAVEHLHKNHKNDIRRGVDGFYVANAKQLFYSKGEEGLRTLIKNIDYRKINKSGDVIPMSSTSKGMEDIIKYINKNSDDLFPVDEHFISKVNDYTRGKVYFRNGYFNTEKKFFKTKQEELPIVYLDRDAPSLSKYTEEMKEEYKQKYLNMFSVEQRPSVLKMTSRAMFGFRDKNWTIMSGLRNSGKGVYQRAVEKSIGDYCSTMELPMTKTQNTGDASQYRFILSAGLHLKRIAFTNEATSIEGKKLKIDGNAIKKFVSGGDAVKCRALYKDEVDVIFNAHMFANVNSIPESDPADAMMTCLPVKMPYKFVSNPEDICERPTDTDIKTKIDAEDPDILFSILVDNFFNRELVHTDLIKDDQCEYNSSIMDNATEAPYIFRTKLVKDLNGWISIIDLKNLFKPSGMHEIMLGKFLKARMTPKRKRIDGKQVCGYGGYKFASENADDYGADDDDSVSDVDD